MKKLILLLTMVAATSMMQAQLVEKDGIYFDSNNHPYSGTYIEYFPDGTIHLEMTLLNGKKDGPTTYFYPNGQKKEVRFFKANLMDGTWITWDENGNKKAEARYNNGQKDGKWLIWDENGTLRYEMEYSGGAKTGVWSIRDEKGNLISQRQY
ncbi:toxin-antitoxin system YwqK family antitoxin [Thermophagus sp. OGC60D27]|uniref:toxin-antitoxin system YwqK family antitoxin n=1 Tax=Thermophagus sp. OGC60D27 TaxID=3458415 RepID=UPI004037864A